MTIVVAVATFVVHQITATVVAVATIVVFFATIAIGAATIVVDFNNRDHCDNCDHIRPPLLDGAVRV